MTLGHKSLLNPPIKFAFPVACTLVILTIFPAFHLTGYTLRLMSMIFMWIALASCWNIMSGYTGYIDFGLVVYFGIGAYSTALLMSRWGKPFFLSILISGVIAALIAVPFGLPTLRLRGAYFSIATFAFAEAMKQVILEWDRMVRVHFFEGSYGITLPIGPSHRFFYYTFLVIMAILFIISYFIERSRMGYALKAIHEAEDAAELVGVNTLKIKVSAYAISALVRPFTRMTVAENALVSAMYGGRMSQREAWDKTRKVLKFVHLDKFMNVPSGNISVPERRRLELARALATSAKVILLDENMAGLTPSEIEEALNMLRIIRNNGITLMVAEHIMRAVMGISDRVIVLDYGEKIAEGTPAEIAENPRVIEAYLGKKYA